MKTTVSLQAIRGFSRFKPHHAQGELRAEEASCFRAICAELRLHRDQELSPATAFDLVPDSVLQELAEPQQRLKAGELTPAEQALACMCFTDLCGELLGYRLLMDAEGQS
ncbi:MAG: hypothetical protein ABJO27_19255 [Pseudoruegeria sp.]